MRSYSPTVTPAGTSIWISTFAVAMGSSVNQEIGCFQLHPTLCRHRLAAKGQNAQRCTYQRESLADARATELDWEPFITTLENHWDGILAYFDERRTSGPVEGLNTKIRVVLRRGYGIRNIATLWTRVLLDVNWAWKKVGNTIGALRRLVSRIRAQFAGWYT